jgi:hypothetical protein
MPIHSMDIRDRFDNWKGIQQGNKGGHQENINIYIARAKARGSPAPHLLSPFIPFTTRLNLIILDFVILTIK